MKGVPEVEAALLFFPPQNFFLLGSWRLSGSPHGLTSLCREEKRERELCALLGPRQCHVSPRQARPDAPTPAFPADSAAIHPALPSITGQDHPMIRPSWEHLHPRELA